MADGGFRMFETSAIRNPPSNISVVIASASFPSVGYPSWI
jgi:hypothetical protein